MKLFNKNLRQAFGLFLGVCICPGFFYVHADEISQEEVSQLGLEVATFVTGPIRKNGSDTWRIRPARKIQFASVEVQDEEGESVPFEFKKRDDELSGQPVSKTEVFFLVDTSHGKRLLDVKAARAIVRQLLISRRPHHAFGLGVFGAKFETLAVISDDVEPLVNALSDDSKFEMRKNTLLYKSVNEAFGEFSRSSDHRKVLVVFSDGLPEDSSSGYSLNDTLLEARKRDIAIVTVLLRNKDTEKGYKADVVTQKKTEFKQLSERTFAQGITLNARSGKPQKYALPLDFRFYEHLEAGGDLTIPASSNLRKLKIYLRSPLPKTYLLHLTQPAIDASMTPSATPGKGDGNEGDGKKEPEGEKEPGLAEEDTAQQAGGASASKSSPLNTRVIALAAALVMLFVIIVVVILLKKRKPATASEMSLVLTGSLTRYLIEKQTTSIGRLSANDITLANNDSVSKRHAVIKLVNSEVIIEDLNSGNGVYVNGQRIQTSRLNHGDTVELGELTFTFNNV